MHHYLKCLALIGGLLTLALEPLWSQNERWATYLSRRTTTRLERSERHLFAVADGALYSVALERGGEVTTYDKGNGLSASGIADIVWHDEAKALVIYYTSGVIDLLGSDGVRTITALRDAQQIRQYTLYATAQQGDRVWLGGAFGLMQLSVGRGVVESTYHQGIETKGIAVSPDGTTLYALVDGQVYAGALATNLQDPAQWRSHTSLPPALGASWVQIGMAGEHLVGLSSSGGLYVLGDGTAPTLLTLPAPLSGLSYTSLVVSGDGLIALSAGGTCYLGADLSPSLIPTTGASDVSGSATSGRLWAAMGEAGISELKLSGNVWQAEPLGIDLDGPYANSYFVMRHVGGRLYTASGGRDGNRYGQRGVVQVFDGHRWSATTSSGLERSSGVSLYDPVDVMPHRDGDPLHYYIATWGEGLYEVRGQELVERYDTHNSALVSALPGQTGYTRVGSLTYDRSGNLWMGVALTSASSGGSVARLAPDGSWAYYDYPSIRPTNSFTAHLALPNGTKWLADYQGANGANGVFVYRDQGTEDIGDDATARYLNFVEASGRSVNFSRISALTLDRSGTLWIGTNMGYMSLLRPDVTPQTGRPPVVTRPIGGNEPPYYYILDNTPVSAIAVDHLNRKWIGTEAGGLYLVSDDGKEVLRHYSEENSPLVSNRILSLAMDEASGLLYIGTDRGLNTLETGTAPERQQATPHAIAYPNPLRPEHPDQITFDDLPAGATIHISDINGRLVHVATSIDTRHTWSTYTDGGHRLPSGVYTARIYAPESKDAQLLRLVIIRSAD